MTPMTENSLRELVKQRLAKSVDGKEIDLLRQDVQIPHLLGITPIGAAHDRDRENGTLLDPSHPFWEDYDERVDKRTHVLEKIDRTLRLLRADNELQIQYPYGEDADIVYISVEGEKRGVECARCGSQNTLTDTRHEPTNPGNYIYIFTIRCLDCEHSGEYERLLTRR